MIFSYSSRSIEQDTEVVKVKTKVIKSDSSSVASSANKKVVITSSSSSTPQRLTTLQQHQKSPVTVSQLSVNSVPSIALEAATPANSITNAANFSTGTPCITVQPVTINAGTLCNNSPSPVLSLVQASNGQVYLIQQQQQQSTTASTTHHHSTHAGGNETLFHHSPMTFLATDNLASTRCDIVTR